jgi:hypothetical protein
MQMVNYVMISVLAMGKAFQLMVEEPHIISAFP